MSDRQDWRDANREVTRGTIWGTRWALGAVAGVIVVVLLGLAMWAWGFGLFSAATAPLRGETEVREQTVADGTYRIAAYERFYDLCASIQAKETAITNLRAELETGPPPDRVTQVNASITANQNQRNASIQRYNAEARMEGTLGQFRASDLPFELDPNEEVTTCTV